MHSLHLAAQVVKTCSVEHAKNARDSERLIPTAKRLYTPSRLTKEQRLEPTSKKRRNITVFSYKLDARLQAGLLHTGLGAAEKKGVQEQIPDSFPESSRTSLPSAWFAGATPDQRGIYQKKPHVVSFPPAILGPEMAAAIFRGPKNPPQIPKSQNTKKRLRVRELFRKVRVIFCLLPCSASQEPNGNCSEKLVQMNCFILGGFFGWIFILLNLCGPSGNFLVLSAGKPPCPQNSSFLGGGVFCFGRGGCKCQFYFYGRGDFSESRCRKAKLARDTLSRSIGVALTVETPLPYLRRPRLGLKESVGPEDKEI